MRTLALLVFLSFVAACGDSGGLTGVGAPQIEVRAGESLVAFGDTLMFSKDIKFTIRNTGGGELLVKEIDLPTHRVFSVDSPELPVTLEADASWSFHVRYEPGQVTQTSERVPVVIYTNQTLPEGRSTFEFRVMPEVAMPALRLQPSRLSYGKVELETSSTKPLNILNGGVLPVEVNRIRLEGDAGYTARIEGQLLDSAANQELVFSPPLVLEPGHSHQINVTYDAKHMDPAGAELVIFSNDPAQPLGLTAVLHANYDGPCVRATPERLDFGARLVGSEAGMNLNLDSCGDLDVTISEVSLLESAGGAFKVALSSISFPIVLEPGDRLAIPVSYKPAAFAPMDEDGNYVLDRGQVLVRSDAYVEELSVELSGFGSDGACPVADIHIDPPDHITPQTELHLSAEIAGPVDDIVTYEWSVIQPDGSLSTFVPSASSPSPTFTPNVVGQYIFRLVVYDKDGRPSCAPAEKIIEVDTQDVIHVELLWHTPGDENEFDEGNGPGWSAGSDVDLHFLHPMAGGFFFDLDGWDCWANNPYPRWGPNEDIGNPRLDRDDVDGAGPENLNMAQPEDGMTYTVGVHYWDDYGYGESYATVRIYIEGVLREVWDDVLIVNGDMWESHTIEWPSRKITRVTDGNEPKITPHYNVR